MKTEDFYPGGADMVRLGIMSREERLEQFEKMIDEDHDCRANDPDDNCRGCEELMEMEMALMKAEKRYAKNALKDVQKKAANHHKRQMDLILDLLK